MMKKIEGGVCAAKGFVASGIHAGIRKNKTKRDLALILSRNPASAAAVYTTNLVKGAPIQITRENLANGMAQAMVCNSGNANTCNADGPQVAREMCEITAKAVGIDAGDVIVASTGVIGMKLDVTPIAEGMPALAADLSGDGNQKAAEAIMTTDTKMKEMAVEFEINGVTCRMGGMAKGSGMIHPNMATMLVFVTTDVAISPEMLQKALSNDILTSFNMITVDGDTSTNDMVSVMANGQAGNETITCEGEAYDAFCQALHNVTVPLCKMIAADGEGATRLIECALIGARSDEIARIVARSVVGSSLVKAAMFGCDANWGRVLCAIGYSGADVDVTKIDMWFESKAGSEKVCENGAGVDFSEEKALEILKQDAVTIRLDFKDGAGAACAWGCDLTYDYVKINGDYRT